jgi:flotillin
LQEIYKDRKKFSKNVYEVASADLMNMGITVISYTLRDVRDDQVNRFEYFWNAAACSLH